MTSAARPMTSVTSLMPAISFTSSVLTTSLVEVFSGWTSGLVATTSTTPCVRVVDVSEKSTVVVLSELMITPCSSTFWYPIIEASTSYSSGTIFKIKYEPSMSVVAPSFVPTMTTLQPMMGSLVSRSMIFPESFPTVCPISNSVAQIITTKLQKRNHLEVARPGCQCDLLSVRILFIIRTPRTIVDYFLQRDSS